DLIPESRLGMTFKVREGQAPGIFERWNARAFKPEGRIRTLPVGARLVVERIVFRKEDGTYEAVQTHVDGKAAYLWAIWNKEQNLELDAGEGPAKDDPQ